jgi:hypothetical protein
LPSISIASQKCRAKRESSRRGHENGLKREGQKTRDLSAFFPAQFSGVVVDAKFENQKNIGNRRAEFAFTEHARIEMRCVEDRKNDEKAFVATQTPRLACHNHRFGI